MEERPDCTRLFIFGPDHETARRQLRTACELYQRGLNVFPLPPGVTKTDLVPELLYTRVDASKLPQLFAGRCNLGLMCGRTSRNLFVIRCLTGKSFGRVLTDLARRHCRSWAVWRGGGGDILLFCQDGPIKSVPASQLKDLEILGEGAYTVVPPAIDEDGVVFEWRRGGLDEPTTVRAAALGWLTDEAGQRVPLEVLKKRSLSDPAPVHALAKRVARQLGKVGDDRVYLLCAQSLRYLSGALNGTRDPDNRQLFKAACDLSGCEFTAEEARQLLIPIARTCHISDESAAATLHKAFSHYRRPARPRENTFTRHPMLFEYIRAFVFATTWSGRTASTDRKVMLALAERTKIDPGETGYYTAAYREIGEHAHISNRGTIRKAFQRLHNEGLIEWQSGSARGGASRFRVSRHVIERGRAAYEQVTESEPLLILSTKGEWHRVQSTNGSLSVIPYSSDAAERGAAGVEGVLVYNLLLQCAPLTTRAVGERLGLKPRQAYYYLTKLRDRHVVTLQGRHWIVTEDLDPEAFAQRFAGPKGKLGKTQQRHEEHQKDRALQLSHNLIQRRMEEESAYPGHWLHCCQCKHAFVGYKGNSVEICPRCGTPNHKGAYTGWDSSGQASATPVGDAADPVPG